MEMLVKWYPVPQSPACDNHRDITTQYDNHINKPGQIFNLSIKTFAKTATVKSFLFVGHLMSCISWVGQSTSLRSQCYIY